MGAPGEPYDPNSGYAPPGQSAQPGAQPGPYPPQQPGYPAQYPGQQPGYPTQYQPYPAYPPPGYVAYPPGYFVPPPGSRRPGTATAANVLGFVCGGLLLASALVLFLGASIIDSFGDNTKLATAELIVDGILNCVAAGLLIAGAVSFGARNANGRILLSVGAGIVIGLSVYWIARGQEQAIFWALVYAALAIIAISLAWTGAVNRWVRGTA